MIRGIHTPRPSTATPLKGRPQIRRSSLEGGASILAVGVTLLFLLLPSFSSAASLNKPANNLGLVGYWSFDDASSTKATDSSGNGNTGTLTNMATSPSTQASGWNPGKLGKGLTFDGVNDSVSLPSTIGFTSSTVTLSAWFKTTDTAGGIVQHWQNVTCGYRLIISSGNLSFTVSNPANTSLTSSTVNDGLWHHAVGTYDGTTMRLYVDGVQVTSGAKSGAIVACAGTGVIGSDSGVGLLAASIDEPRIYNRALTAAQVLALYNAGEAQFKQPTKNGLVGYWSFDDASSTKATDSSGNGNTGTLTNMAFPATASSGWTINGKRGYGLAFDGTDDYVTLPNLDYNSLTFSAWIKRGRTSAGNFDRLLMSVNSNGWGVYMDSNNTIGFTKVAVSNTNSSGTITDTNWHHVVVTYDGANSRYYIDGVLDSSPSYAVSFSGGGSYTIGSRGTGEYFQGKIDEVRIYNRALSATEVANLYASGARAVNASQNVTGSSLDSGLVGLWSFNGSDLSGTTATDGSGGGNTGTLTNGPIKTIGKVGQALIMDGVDDYVSVASSNISGTGSHSVCAWIKPSASMGSSFATVAVKGTNVLTNLYLLSSGTGVKAQVNTSAGGVHSTVSPALTITSGEWHHACSVFVSGSSITVYADGTNSASQAMSDSVLRTGAPNAVDIGWDGFVGDNFFQGSIDEVRIYNRALSASEVKQLYNMGK